MTKEEFLMQLNGIKEKAKSLLARDKHLAAVAFMFKDSGMFLVPFGEDKDLTEKVIKIVAGDIKPECVITVAEAWMATAPADGQNPLDIRIKPSEHPEREECVMVSGVCPGVKMSIITRFSRAENGDIVFKEEKTNESFFDRFIGDLFPEVPVHSMFN